MLGGVGRVPDKGQHYPISAMSCGPCALMAFDARVLIAGHSSLQKFAIVIERKASFG
jgi:hypothetical protein